MHAHYTGCIRTVNATSYEETGDNTDGLTVQNKLLQITIFFITVVIPNKINTITQSFDTVKVKESGNFQKNKY